MERRERTDTNLKEREFKRKEIQQRLVSLVEGKSWLLIVFRFIILLNFVILLNTVNLYVILSN